MFIRKDIQKVKNKVYQHYRLVETYRSPKGIRQRTVLSLGRLSLPKKKWHELVELIEDALYGQKPLFAVDPRLLQIAERAARKILNEKRKRSKGSNSG